MPLFLYHFYFQEWKKSRIQMMTSPPFLQKLLSEGRAFLLSLGGSEGARGPFQQAGVLTEPNSLMDSGAFLPFVLRSLKSLR